MRRTAVSLLLFKVGGVWSPKDVADLGDFAGIEPVVDPHSPNLAHLLAVPEQQEWRGAVFPFDVTIYYTPEIVGA